MPQYGNLINAHTNKGNLATGYGLLCGMLYNYNIIKFESSDNDFKGAGGFYVTLQPVSLHCSFFNTRPVMNKIWNNSF